ncbi:MAG: ribonuclease J [Candidatus Buchananbacteria bacterium]
MTDKKNKRPFKKPWVSSFNRGKKAELKTENNKETPTKTTLLSSFAGKEPALKTNPWNNREPVLKTNSWSSKEPALKIIPLGGCEEIGRNMTVMEYDGDIIILDMGLQFPEEDMPGIDYIIPNISYLKGKEKNIKAIVITHAHLDHIGALPHLLPLLGNPLIVGGNFTIGLIKRRQEEFKNNKNRSNYKIVTPNDKITLGKFKLEFIHTNHNIPDCLMVVVHTPQGSILYTGDWKFDYTPVDDKPADFAKLARVGDEGILAIMCDSTNAGQEGHQISEREVGKALRQIMSNVTGRLIIGTFGSLLSRVKQIIEIADDLGKKVAIDGYSMKINVEIAQQMGYIKPKNPCLIEMSKVEDYPENKVVIIGTGAQGEDNAMLMKLANREHRDTRIYPGDTVVLSSSVVPGNELAVQKLKDTLYREGANIINYQMMDVHAGGHAKNEEVKLLLRLVRPKYYIPVHGNYSLLKENSKTAKSIGFEDKHIIIPDNGSVISFKGGEGAVASQKVPADYVFIDGLGVGNSSNVVLRDRQQLAEEGMVVVIALIDTKTGDLIHNPDIISRGFVYLKENKNLIEMTRNLVKKLLKSYDFRSATNDTYIKDKIRNDLGKFLFQKTEKKPMVLPVIIEV